MAQATRIYLINEGTPDAIEDTTFLLGTGSAGTPGAKRRLVHPDSANFPAISYEINPKRTLNFDKVPLPADLVSVALTEGTTQLLRGARDLDDTICTEQWTAAGGTASMPASLWRLLYEYDRNPPPFSIDPGLQTYITWEPRDISDETYNVEIVRVFVGNGQRDQEFDVLEHKAQGGSEVNNSLSTLDVPGTGILDRPVVLVMRIVSQV